MLIDAHVHIFPKVDGYGPKGHTHGAGYGRIDAGDGIAQDVLPAINEKTSHTLQMLLHEMRQGQVDKRFRLTSVGQAMVLIRQIRSRPSQSVIRD